MEYSISQDIASGTLNEAKLGQEIISANCVSGFQGIMTEGDVLKIFCDSITNQESLDATIHNHVAVSLDEKKIIKKKEIDAKTQALIRAGFDFDGNHFSLSPNAQLNWIGVLALRCFEILSSQQLLPWPLPTTNEADGEYDLAQGDVIAFIGTGMAIVNAQLIAGRDLKIACNNVSTQEELDAVVDNR